MSYPIPVHLPDDVFHALTAFNAQGCGNRNAWRALWLRFPGDARWRLAADCRDTAREMGT